MDSPLFNLQAQCPVYSEIPSDWHWAVFKKFELLIGIPICSGKFEWRNYRGLVQCCFWGSLE